MAVKVVDASALVALIFIEAEAEQISDRLGEFELVAPALLQFELANACLMKLRRNPDQRDNILRQYFSQAGMLIGTRDIDQVEVLELAEQFRLTAYDASYLWLARELSTELVTLDWQLERAAASLQHR